MSRQSILRRAFAEVMVKTPNGTPSMFEPLTDDGEFPDYMAESLYKEYEKIDVIVSSEAQARIAELEAELDVKKAQVNDAVTSGAKLANAVGRLVAGKGRYHTEQNYSQLVKALEAYRENR